MKTIYQIKAGGITAYADTRQMREHICGVIVGNGYTPQVRRLSRMDVPTSDIKVLTIKEKI